MASPSIVILTDPANCQLVEGQLLVEALLQAQQLSREGSPISQTYCDNPAAAAEFMDAYAKAYPGLELQSADLPRPEQLYSMLASGRLAPLPVLDDASPTGAAPLNPLVVLSLGKPDGLMQALQSLRSVRNSINVIEIAPDTAARTAPISVAAAVAGHALADTSWSVETGSHTHRHGGEEAANAPLSLDALEFNVDDFHTNASREQAQHSSPASGIEGRLPASAAGEGGAESPVHADPVAVRTVGGMILAAEADPIASTVTPAPEPSVTPTPQPATAPAPEPAVLAAGSSQSPDTHATDGPLATVARDQGPAPDDVVRPDSPGADPTAAEPADGVPDRPADPSPDADRPAGLAPTPDTPDHASNTATGPDASAADPKTSESDDGDFGHDRSSFGEPGGDVVYAPTGTFTTKHDLSYPLPAAAAEADALGSALHLSMADEVIDLDAILTHHGADLPATEPFDPTLLRPPGSNDHRGHDVYSPQPQHVDLGHLDLPGADHDSHQDKVTTPVHDLDL